MLIISIWTLLCALIVTVIIMPIGFVWSLGYAIRLLFLGDIPGFFLFFWHLIDGICHAIGEGITNIAIALDMCWNVNGEIIEDCVTAEEKTTFSKKGITVSASIGRLEIDGKLNPTGKRFSKILNVFFCQKQHAVDSWNYLEERTKIQSKYFKSK